MEIILIMNNMQWVLASLIVGVVSGLICALIAWIIKPIPRVKICTEISFNKGDNKYHFKIQNIGGTEISISSLYIILCYKGEFYNIKGVEIPLLHSEKHAKQMSLNYTYERKILIDVLRIKPNTILKTKDSDLINKYKAKQLSLKDFVDKDKKLQIYIGLMAINCQYNTTKFYADALDMNIKEGEYFPGKCFVENHTTPTE